MTTPLLSEWLARQRSRVVARGMIVSWLALEEGRGEDQAPGLITLPPQTAVGSGVETATLVEVVLVSDAGTGTSTATIDVTVVGQTGSGATTATIGIVPDVNGTGSGAETELIGGVLGDSETGSGAETELVTV